MQKRARRHPTDMATRVFYKDMAYRADVANVSAGGARLSGLSDVPLGAEVTVKCHHLCIRARVAWCGDNEVGVRFHVPLSAADRRMLQDAAGIDLARLDRVQRRSTP